MNIIITPTSHNLSQPLTTNTTKHHSQNLTMPPNQQQIMKTVVALLTIALVTIIRVNSYPISLAYTTGEITFCDTHTNSTTTHRFIIEYTHPPSTPDSLCEFCEVSVAIIKDEIAYGNATIHFIEDIVLALCNIFNVEKLCTPIINDINYIVNLIEKGWSAPQICKELHLCNTSTIDTRANYVNKYAYSIYRYKQNEQTCDFKYDATIVESYP